MNKKPIIILHTILALFLFCDGVLFSESFINYESGSYDEDLLLCLSNISNSDEVFYSFSSYDQNKTIPYSGGLLLSALPGEERTYSIDFVINGETSHFEYLIDKRKPESPELIYISEADNSGYGFTKPVPSGVKFFYGYDEYNRDKLFQWEGELLNPPKSGYIYYFAEDAAGNRSDVDFLQPEQIAENTYRRNLTIKSPVEGVFLNTQLLYIDKEGFEWIKYTLNGYDPVENGAEYNEPVEIRRYGSVTLKVAAKPLNSEKIIRKELNYQVNTRAPLKNIPESGIYASALSIKSYLNGYRYCIEDRSPGTDDMLFDKDITINPIYGGVKYSIVRINDSEGEEPGDYRYFYVIDDRFPANPIINFNSRLPEENKLDVSISGPVYSEIYYTTDGTTPGKTSTLFREKFTIEVPDNKNAGSIIIKARAISLNGKPSRVVSRIFTFDTLKPDIPEVEFRKNPVSGLYEIEYQANEDERLYYQLINQSGEDEIHKNDFRPVVDNEFFVDVPDGMVKNFRFIFASVDSSGNWSNFTEPLEVLIDKKVPEAPIITFENNSVSIISENDVNYSYTITKNGVLLNGDEGLYTEPLAFNDEYYDSTLQLNVIVSDKKGNKYKTSVKYHFPKQPFEKEAVLFSEKSEDIYSGQEVSFYAYPDGINDQLFYYLTEYFDDGSENTTGPIQTDGYITVEGIENSTKKYFLEVFSVNNVTDEKSRVSSYEFIIDNEKPDVPVISGLKNNSVVGDRVTLTAAKSSDAVVFLNYSNDEESLGYLFSKKSIVFNKPLVFDVEDGLSKDFYLKIGAGDAAGNSVENEEIFHFRIDKKAPEISGVDINTQSLPAGSFEISVKGEPNVRYYYESGFKGENIETPDLSSRFFEEKLTLGNEQVRENTYIVKIIPVDEAGNAGRYPYSLMYRVDNQKPVAVEPQTVLNEKYKKIFTKWSPGKDNIFYRIIKDGIDTAETAWTEYSNPFSIKYISENKEVSIEYYSVDENGNRSSKKIKQIILPTTSNTELASGIENNKFYNSDLELKRLNRKSIIRYEITTEQAIPPEVSVFSPVLPETLPFIIENGESINFTVSLKEFKNEEDQRGGAEQVLKFTIDKQLPEPPEIGGIRDGEYYLKDCTAYFEPSVDKIFYSINSSLNFNDDFREYTEAFDIQSPDGTYGSFTVKAYTEDYAGNQSAVKTWGITIDKEIIYVSAGGRDYYEGTRSKPYQSLSKALEQVKYSKRKTIFLEEGEYQLQSPAVVDEAVTIYGGFIKGNWQEKSGISIIKIDRRFPEDNPAFYIYGGNFTIENIKMNIAPETASSVFYVNKGNLNIRNSEINMSAGSETSFINQNYGKLLISNSIFSGIISQKPVISNDYGTININNTDFDFISEGEESTLISAENCIDYNITSSEISIDGGKTITALKFVNSSVKLRSNNIVTKNAGVTATAITSVDSRIDLNYCKIISADSNRISRAIVSEDSRLLLEGNTAELDAGAGLLGFNLTGGSSKFLNNNIKTGECNDFIYLFMMIKGEHRIETNIMNTDSADDIVFLRSKDSEIDFFNNTIMVRSGRNGSIAFKPEEGAVNRIINNIIYNLGEDKKAVLLYQDDESNMISIKNNCLFGWSSYAEGLVMATDLISLDLIDGVYSAGRYASNITESPDKTFTGENTYQLSEESRCIDAGYDLGNILESPLDMDGEMRPNSMIQRDGGYDIGADEFYQ